MELQDFNSTLKGNTTTDIDAIHKKLSYIISKKDFLRRIQEYVENIGEICPKQKLLCWLPNNWASRMSKVTV